MAESGPRLHLESRLMSPSRLARLGQRRGSPEFGAALQALVRSAQVYVSVSPVAPVTPVTPITMEPPDQPAGFYHDYFCPDHAVELSFDARTPDRHRCPEDGRIFSGEPYDSAWRWFVNNRLSLLPSSSPWSGALTGTKPVAVASRPYSWGMPGAIHATRPPQTAPSGAAEPPSNRLTKRCG